MNTENPRYRIRTLEPAHLGSLRALHRALIDEDSAYRKAPGEYGEDDLESLAALLFQILENPNNVYLVAVSAAPEHEAVIGYIRFLQNTSRQRTRHNGLFGMGVHAEFRSKGLGQALLNALLGELQDTEIERVSLHVFSDNEGAIRFYERNGFVASGTLPGEIKMEDGRYRDLILMHRWIK